MKQMLLVPMVLCLAYANIDLKNTRFFVKDGGNNTSIVGAVNNAGGYTIGSTTILVNGFTAALTNGGTIVIGARSYLIVSSIGGATPTSVTIAAPGLTAAVANLAVVTAYPVQNSVEIVIGNGNLTYDENRNMVYTMNRGLLDDVREGDQVPVDVSFQFNWDYIKGSSAGSIPSIEDALKKQNNASAWVSSDTDTCKPYAVDIVIVDTPTCAGSDIETITLSDFRYEKLAHDPKNAQVSVSGKCNVTRAIVARG